MPNTYFAVLLLVLSSNVGAQINECQNIKAIQKETGILPLTLDNGVKLSKIKVDCDHRVLSQKIYLPNESETVSSGFQSLEQSELIKAQCDPKGMSTHGWSYEKEYYDRHHQLIFKAYSTPSLCTSMKLTSGK